MWACPFLAQAVLLPHPQGTAGFPELHGEEAEQASLLLLRCILEKKLLIFQTPTWIFTWVSPAFQLVCWLFNLQS